MTKNELDDFNDHFYLIFFFFVIFNSSVVQPPAPPVIYIHFEEDQGWTNHGVDFVMEETPFASVSLMIVISK